MPEGAVITVNINGKEHQLNVPGDMPLLWALRDELDLKGTKFGCGIAMCGACTVHIDGEAQRSCIMPVGSLGKAKVVTIEGLDKLAAGKALQAAWLEHEAMQCGYCQAGQLMSASALLTHTPKPTDDDIDGAMEGNLCRCATYQRIRAAIKAAAGLPLTDGREV
jgi:isoquinoline 1-oxidoreductase alpha subunit